MFKLVDWLISKDLRYLYSIHSYIKPLIYSIWQLHDAFAELASACVFCITSIMQEIIFCIQKVNQFSVVIINAKANYNINVP